MNKTDGFTQKSNFSVSASNLNTESKSPTSNFAGSSTQSSVNINIKKLKGRQRHVFATIQIPYSIRQVWQVLTNYEAFTEFIPTLVQSRRLNRPSGGIRMEEVRTNSLLGINFSARSIFDIEEKFPHEIYYQLVEGDMKTFSGYWRLKPLSLSESKQGIELIFDFFVLPQRFLPMVLVEHMLRQNIPANMRAIRQRVETIFEPQ